MKKNHLTFLLIGVCSLTIVAQEHTMASLLEGERTLSADSLIATNRELDSLLQTLPEVMITGERPMVKAEQGKLVYDLPRLISDLPVDNVYDAVKELPGVTEQDGTITLGGQSVTVVLDGKVTTLTPSQLTALLKSIPADRIEKAEVMYTTPARYQVRGAMINICLKQNKTATPSWQGELFSDYKQKHYEVLSERASILYSHRKFSADFLYSYSHGRGYFLTDKEALHTLANGTVYPMDMQERMSSRNNEHSVRVGGDYNFAKDHWLSAVYQGNFNNNRTVTTSTGVQESNIRRRGTGGLHNGRLDYSTPCGLKVGAEFTYYDSPSTQWLSSRMSEEGLDFRSESEQRINRWKAFLAQEHSVGKGWGINYGAIYTTSVDHSYQYYYDIETGVLLTDNDNMKSRRREQTWNFYAGFNKSFGSKLSLDASLAVEQFHTPVWNEWTLFPTVTLNYTPAAGQVWQLSFSSDKSYPDYWATQETISYMGGGYSEIHGNPYLKPSIDYHLQLLHVLKSKYVFSTWYSYKKNDFKQLLYQSPDRLVEVYKFFNADFNQRVGVQSVIPFKVSNWLNSRFTLVGVYDRQKNNAFWDLPYDRDICYAIASMSNTFTLSTQPDIKLTVSGMIRSKAIQGVYDLPSSGALNADVRYTFAKGKGILTLRCRDILETAQISPRIRYDSQYVTNDYSSFREFAVSLTYKFGGYREKKREAVDTSRFK